MGLRRELEQNLSQKLSLSLVRLPNFYMTFLDRDSSRIANGLAEPNEGASEDIMRLIIELESFTTGKKWLSGET